MRRRVRSRLSIELVGNSGYRRKGSVSPAGRRVNSSIRLLRKPGGFEGLGPMFVLIYTQNLAVAQRVDLIEAAFDFDPARSTTTLESNRHEHSVSAPDHLLECGLSPHPGFVPAFVVRQHGVVAVQGTVLQADH